VDDGVLDDGGGDDVDGGDELAILRWDKDIAGLQAQECCFWDVRVRAPEPEDGGRSTLSALGKKEGFWYVL